MSARFPDKDVGLEREKRVKTTPLTCPVPPCGPIIILSPGEGGREQRAHTCQKSSLRCERHCEASLPLPWVVLACRDIPRLLRSFSQPNPSPPCLTRPQPMKPTGTNIKAERSWRDGGAASTATAGGDKAADPVVSAQTARASASPQSTRTAGAAGEGAGVSRRVVDPGGIRSRVWPSTRIEGRPNDVYFEYEELLEATGDHRGALTSLIP